MENEELELHARIEDAHWWFRARREIILDALARVAPPDAGRTVLEIGCGTGGNLRFLQARYRVAGVDTSPVAVGYAKRRVSGDVIEGDFRGVPADVWKGIDAVLLADVLEHVEADSAFLRDVVERLPAGSGLVITVPAHPSLWGRHDRALGHVRRYSAATLRSLWAGLPVDERWVSPFNAILFPAIAAVRLLRRPGDPAAGRSDLRMPRDAVNDVLYRVFSLERHVLRHAPLPWGLSYIAVLAKRA